jgi:dihydrofolate synthase / folylpolyglutamate synthase
VTAFEYLSGLEQFGIKFGLANISAILRQLDRPELAFRSVHIAGTNGKGSVTAMTEAGLRAAGYRTARYTSPHLVSLNERFLIQGRAVTDEALIDAIETVRSAVETLRSNGTLDVQPTFFEVTTAAGFELFRRSAVEIAVVEVGLGGRLDATNVLMPEATAITSIALDHQLFLGSTLASIAREKAGIVKPGVPLVIGELDAEAEAVIAGIAREQGAPLIRALAADVATRHIGLAGAHQRANAAIAVRLLETLNRGRILVPTAAIEQGLQHPEWPGRLDSRGVADGRRLLMDAAHNPAGAEALARHLRELAGPPLPLVFAAMRDKDIRGMFRVLLPAVSSLTVTRASHLRSANPADLAGIARDIAPEIQVAVESSIPQALESAWRRSPSGNVVVAGSIFLLGDVIKELGLD